MDTVQVSERFRKREFVLEYADNPEYPEHIKFELAQDRCELLDSFQPGQKVHSERNFVAVGRTEVFRKRSFFRITR